MIVEHLSQMVWEHPGKDTASVSVGSSVLLQRPHSIKQLSSRVFESSTGGATEVGHSRRILFIPVDNNSG